VAIEGGNPLTVVNKGYGWKPGLPDIRDYRLNFSGAEVAPEVDLRKTGYAAQIWDQGPLGSCTAHGAGFAYAFDLEKQGQGDDFTPSRLYIYYNTRVIEGTVSEDSGASITDAIKSINKYGAPPEADWQYNTDRFTEKPSVQAYTDGALRQAVKYARVNQTVADMQACLTAGTPIVIGFTVYESFESQAVADTGDVPMPTTSEQVMGGHCVAVVGLHRPQRQASVDLPQLVGHLVGVTKGTSTCRRRTLSTAVWQATSGRFSQYRRLTRLRSRQLPHRRQLLLRRLPRWLTREIRLCGRSQATGLLFAISVRPRRLPAL
jgi:hypothetical protein